MNKSYRSKVVRAMDTLAYCINDEYVLERWLVNGVADGDIIEGEDVPEEYLDDETFQELLDLFMKLIAAAKKSGGLYCDRVSTRYKERIDD